MSKHSLDNNKVGLALGSFGALVHAVWLFFVAVTPQGVQRFYEWILTLHHIRIQFVILPFDIFNAMTLIVVVFCMWYAFGWVFAKVWNWQIRS